MHYDAVKNALIFLYEGLTCGMLSLQELKHQVDLIHDVAMQVFAETGMTVKYKVGTMIEIPRAALVADEVCPVVS